MVDSRPHWAFLAREVRRSHHACVVDVSSVGDHGCAKLRPGFARAPLTAKGALLAQKGPALVMSILNWIQRMTQVCAYLIAPSFKHDYPPE